MGSVSSLGRSLLGPTFSIGRMSRFFFGNTYSIVRMQKRLNFNRAICISGKIPPRCRPGVSATSPLLPPYATPLGCRNYNDPASVANFWAARVVFGCSCSAESSERRRMLSEMPQKRQFRTNRKSRVHFLHNQICACSTREDSVTAS